MPIIKKYLSFFVSFFGTKTIFGLSCAVSVLQMIITKHIYSTYKVTPSEMLFWRSIFLIAILAPLAVKFKPKLFPRKSINVYFLLNAVTALSLYIWYNNQVKIETNHAVLISFLTPVFAVFASNLILREKISSKIIIAMIFCIIGTIFITEPSKPELHYAYILLIFCAGLRALCSILTKIVNNNESLSSNFYSTNFLLALIMIVFCWPDSFAINYIAALFIFLATVLYLTYFACFNLAIRYSKVNLLQPVDFIRLPLSIILSWVFFQESLTMLDLIGGSLIVVGFFYSNKIKS